MKDCSLRKHFKELHRNLSVPTDDDELSQVKLETNEEEIVVEIPITNFMPKTQEANQISNHITTAENDRGMVHEGIQFDGNSANKNLNRHIRIVRQNEEPLEAERRCDYKASRNKAFKVKQTDDFREQLHKCPHCERSFKSTSTLWAHKKIHDNQTRFKCDFEGCHYSSHSVSHFKRHQAVHSEERPHQCYHCEVKFKTSDALLTHKKIHDNQTRFKCDFEGCHYSSHNISHLKRHQAVHSDERPHKCPHCELSFKLTKTLWAHKKIHDSQDSFKCDFEGCHYSSYKISHFKLHQTAHSDERSHKCPHCELSFKSTNTLPAHKKIHDSQASFKCDFEGCHYSSNNISNFKNHQAIHSSERTHKCSHCELSFKSTNTLRAHWKIHDNQTRFKCDFEGCHYSSYSVSHLKNHQAVHSDERPHKCPHCELSFKSTNTLRSHKKIHVRQACFKCDFEGCHFATRHADSLRRHQKLIHGSKELTKAQEEEPIQLRSNCSFTRIDSNLNSDDEVLITADDIQVKLETSEEEIVENRQSCN